MTEKKAKKTPPVVKTANAAEKKKITFQQDLMPYVEQEIYRYLIKHWPDVFLIDDEGKGEALLKIKEEIREYELKIKNQFEDAASQAHQARVEFRRMENVKKDFDDKLKIIENSLKDLYQKLRELNEKRNKWWQFWK